MNHPWRNAYARCTYCGRPFCYADLVDYKKKSYCLEDIDYAGVMRQEAGPNVYTYLVSILFLATSFILIYYNYQQIPLIQLAIQTIGVRNFIYSLAYSYIIVLGSLFFAVLGLFACLAALGNSGKRLAVTVLTLFMMLLFFPYEYLTGTTTGYPDYLLYVNIILLVNMVMLMFSRMGYVGSLNQQSFSNQSEWPRLETF